MKLNEGKIEKIKIIILVVLILIVIGIGFMVFGDKKSVEKIKIDLEDNSFINNELEVSDYDVPILDVDEKSLSSPIEFYDYKSEYITVNVGENYETPYKNTLKSIILKNVSNEDINEIEKVVKDYKQNVLKYLDYDETKPITEFDRHKDLSKELDETKSMYENLKSGETNHHMVLFEERLGYDIILYVENNTLIGEISYYMPQSGEKQ